MPTKNIELKRKYRREWYHRNSEHARKKVLDRKKDIKAWFKSYKATLKCSMCPENHPATLDFHHRDQETKDIEVGTLVHRAPSKETIMEEIEKCDVFCANCHRKLHYNEK